VVPAHFEDYKKSNQYQTSTIIKYLFTQQEIPTVYDTHQPTELRVDPCLGAFVRLFDTSGVFLTRVRIELVDCEGKLILETVEGTSKSKDYLEAYKEALMAAFSSINGINYQYTPPSKDVTNQDVAAQDADIVPLVEELPQPTADAIIEPIMEAGELNGAAQVEQALPALDYLYAQPTDSGYQLVDNVPSIRMLLIKTSKSDTFLAVINGQNSGTVFKSDGVWVREFLNGTELVQEILHIKF
jgi:hypothetical protein